MDKTIITKRCSKCNQIKQFSEFHKDNKNKSGYRTDCKVCNLKRVSKYHQTKQGKTTRKQYRQTEKYKTAHRKRISRYTTRHPEQDKARKAIKHAIRDGKIQKASSFKCNYCPKQAQEYHHHKGYAKKHWLDVLPVCKICHKKYP